MVKLDLLELFNQTFLRNNITHGVLICLPKSDGDNTLNSYRPISLLNTDYKIMAWVVARRLRQDLSEQLQHTKFCGVPSSSILDAASQVRDVIAHAENTGNPLCILTLDFHKAFVQFSHKYVLHLSKLQNIAVFHRPSTRNVQRRNCLSPN